MHLTENDYLFFKILAWFVGVVGAIVFIAWLCLRYNHKKNEKIWRD